MKIRASVVISLLLSVASICHAKVKWVDIGINGLTCSMCTRSVEMSLRRLDFVDTVMMSLETTEGRVYLKENMPVDFSQLAKAVVKAGFSVRFVKMEVSDLRIDKDGFFVEHAQMFRVVDFDESKDILKVSLQIVDEDFLPKKEQKKYEGKVSASKIKDDQKFLHVVQSI